MIYESYSIFTRSTLNTTYMDSIYKIRAHERSLEELEYIFYIYVYDSNDISVCIYTYKYDV